MNIGDTINGKRALSDHWQITEVKAVQKKRKWLGGLFLVTLYNDMKQSQSIELSLQLIF